MSERSCPLDQSSDQLLALLLRHHCIEFLEQPLHTFFPLLGAQLNAVAANEWAYVVRQLVRDRHGGILNEHRDHRDHLLLQGSGDFRSHEIVCNCPGVYCGLCL